MNYLIFDQFLFETAADFQIEEEVMFAQFKYMQFTKAGSPTERDTPLFDTLGITKEDYDQFWSYLDVKIFKWLTWFNTEIFGNGVPLPYWNLQFLTYLSFYPRAMVIAMDMYYNLIK